MAEPLQVALVATFYPPDSFGGDGVHVRRLADGLRERGHAVTVVHNPTAYRLLGGAPGSDPVDPDAVGEPSGRRARLATTATYLTGRPTGYGRRLAEAVAGAEVVHLHNPSLLGGPAALGLGSPGAVRLYTTHEHWLLCPMHVLFRNGKEVCTTRTCVRCSLAHRRPPQPWRATGVLTRAVANVDLVLSPSEYTAALHRAAFPDAEVRVHPLPGPADADVAAALAMPPVDRPRPYVLYAGRLEPVKGVLELATAFAAARGVDLLLAGTGSLLPQVEDLAARDPGLVLLGPRPRTEVLRLARDAVAVVIPSAGLETFGGVAVEAMAMGTPVVVRDLGPLPELLTDGGGLAGRSDADLVEALQRLVDDPALRATMASEARASASGRYGEPLFFRRWFEAVAFAAGRRGLDRLASRAAAHAEAEG